MDTQKTLKEKGIGVGSAVRVFRKARRGEPDGDLWVNSMDYSVGKTLRLMSISKDGMVLLSNGYYYPHQVLCKHNKKFDGIVIAFNLIAYPSKSGFTVKYNDWPKEEYTFRWSILRNIALKEFTISQIISNVWHVNFNSKTKILRVGCQEIKPERLTELRKARKQFI